MSIFPNETFGTKLGVCIAGFFVCLFHMHRTKSEEQRIASLPLLHEHAHPPTSSAVESGAFYSLHIYIYIIFKGRRDDAENQAKASVAALTAGRESIRHTGASSSMK